MRETDERIAQNMVCWTRNLTSRNVLWLKNHLPMVELIDYCEEYAAEDYWIINYSNPAVNCAKATQNYVQVQEL